MKILAIAAGVVLAVASSAAPAHAADTEYKITLLAKAKADECFNGVGVVYPVGPPCAEGQAKVNQAYVWGLTRVGDDVWFGTGANVHCLTEGATLDISEPKLTDDYVCEYGESQTIKNDPDIPISVGDMRPPEVWLYNAKTKKNVKKSTEINAASEDDKYRLAHTIGLRAAGNFNNVVLLGGPTTDERLNMFAFDAKTKKFLGSHTFDEYGNIRTFLQTDDALYLGVGIGRNGADGGAVVRWEGSKTSPFDFVSVGDLPVQAADLTLHDGRIAATSWPAEGSGNQTAKVAGVWLSPPLADNSDPALTTADAAGWTQIWNAAQYEPDRVTAATYGLGGVASYDGWLYWGTMHVPTKATKVHQKVYPQTTEEAKKLQVKYTQRAISIWRGRNLGTADQEIQLLYGNANLPAYSASTGTWSSKTTNFTPLYGSSGFGNAFNNYTWRMLVVGGKLFVGTMDWSYLADSLIPEGSGNGPDPAGFGGELWVFPSSDAAATAVSTTGLGNYLNYGVRNMIPDGKGGIYLGMANPMNLRTDLTDDIPEGGWELQHLTICP
ncbi:hypothetical protein [Actinoplanes sp. NPDC051851]|uniref:hypothetical protein n=1 Tax=Actinoplanes sp. NPDC051851 TaxID=3154753 RepID=UPI0034334910